MIGSVLLLGLFHFGTTQTVQVNVCGVPGTPVITAPVTGLTTAGQSLQVNGMADANTAVAILDNGQLAASLTSDGSGDFSGTIGLTSGTNSIVAQVGNACVPTVNSTAVAVTYNPPVPPNPNPTPTTPSATPSVTPPPVVSIATSSSPTTVLPEIAAPTKTLSGQGLSLGITSASDGLTTQSEATQMTTSDSVLIGGNTGVSANVAIVVNGRVVADVLSDKDGNFRVRVPLRMGKNVVQFTATLGDKTITKSLTFERTAAVARLGIGTIISYLVIFVAIILWILLFLLVRRRKHGEAEERLKRAAERVGGEPNAN